MQSERSAIPGDEAPAEAAAVPWMSLPLVERSRKSRGEQMVHGQYSANHARVTPPTSACCWKVQVMASKEHKTVPLDMDGARGHPHCQGKSTEGHSLSEVLTAVTCFGIQSEQECH